jgi:plasmid stability protein
MVIDLPEQLENAVKVQANARGVSPEGYVRNVLERELEPALSEQPSPKPYKTGYGSLAKYGPAPTTEEMDENRAEMFQNFGKDF